MFDAIGSGELIPYAGVGAAFEPEPRKKLLKKPVREADWAAIIDRLMTEFDLTYDELSEMTDISVSVLHDYRNEKKEFTTGNKALRLLGLFTLNFGRDEVPLIGEYHEIKG